jgi:hypothetical protein
MAAGRALRDGCQTIVAQDVFVLAIDPLCAPLGVGPRIWEVIMFVQAVSWGQHRRVLGRVFLTDGGGHVDCVCYTCWGFLPHGRGKLLQPSQ